MRTILRAVVATGLGVIIMSGFTPAADKPKPPEPGKALPAETPLELTLDGTVKYPLGADAQSEEALKNGFATDRFPNPPKVELKLVLKNTSDKAVKVWSSGDPVTIDLTLSGKGAVSVAPRVVMTREFRIPKAVEVEAGKTIEIPLKQLSGGMRGMGQYCYWTKTGEYELTAVLNTAMSPAPKGAEAAEGGFGKVHVASKALKITIEEKK
jgi:hypothetical protein